MEQFAALVLVKVLFEHFTPFILSIAGSRGRSAQFQVLHKWRDKWRYFLSFPSMIHISIMTITDQIQDQR